VHRAGLEFSAYVGVDLAAENDFFEYGSGPRHDYHLRVKFFLGRDPARRGGVEKLYHCEHGNGRKKELKYMNFRVLIGRNFSSGIEALLLRIMGLAGILATL